MMLWCRGLKSWSLQIQCAPPHHNQVTKKVLLNLTTNSIVLGLNFFLKIVLPPITISSWFVSICGCAWIK